MLCDICKKNQATIHIKEMHNNKWTSINLCIQCAQKHNLDTHDSIPQMDISKMLIELGKVIKEQEEKTQTPAPEEDKKITLPDIPDCPVCGWGIEDIRKNPGKLGCSGCYAAFHELLENTFKKIQKGRCHIGKHPLNSTDESEKAYEYVLAILNKQLAECIADENYEEAAKKRDMIALMRKKHSTTGSRRSK